MNKREKLDIVARNRLGKIIELTNFTEEFTRNMGGLFGP